VDLWDILELLIPLSEGKLPNHLLGRFLEESPLDDPSLLVSPAVGEDIAAVAIGAGDDVVVLKSDPITFTVDRLGYSTVVINANDLATSGAAPRWLLTTLLFPVGASAARIRCVMRELQQASREFGLTLCGGHTEVTRAVRQPVAVGHLAGTTSRDRLIDKRRMRRGDRILLTKGVALEGTAILARDFSGELEAVGMPRREVESCQRLFVDPGISVLAEARLAVESGGVTAMHDVTEGGLATALEELSTAGRRRIRVFVERIPIFPETRALCDLLGIDPLGLLGSGGLLIACRPDASTGLLDALRRANVAVSEIGEALGEGVGIEALRDSAPVDWPRFEVDEIVAAIRRLTGVSSQSSQRWLCSQPQPPARP
jgi:hydrogenase maturation factor